MSKTPYGYKFSPTDIQFVNLLVNMKLKQKSIPPFLEKSLYGDQLPWEVLTDDDPSWEYTTEGDSVKLKTVYVFTPLSVKGTNKVLRTAGSGTWEGKAATHEIKNRGQLIGNKRVFTFRKKEKNQEQQVEENNNKGRWIMHEYTTSLVKGDYAVCNITVDRLPNNLDVGCSTSSGSATRKRKASSLGPDLETEEQEIIDCFPNHVDVGCSTSTSTSSDAARTSWISSEDDGVVKRVRVEEQENQEIFEIEEGDLNNTTQLSGFEFLDEILAMSPLSDEFLKDMELFEDMVQQSGSQQEAIIPGSDNESILTNTYPSRDEEREITEQQQQPLPTGSQVLNEDEDMDDASFVSMLNSFLDS